MATDADELDADIQQSLQQLHSLTDALGRRLQQRAKQKQDFLLSQQQYPACSTLASSDDDLQTAAWPGSSGEPGLPCNADVNTSYLSQAPGSCSGSNTAATQLTSGADAGRAALTNKIATAQGQQDAASPGCPDIATSNEQADAELGSTSYWSQSTSSDIHWDKSLMALAGEQVTPCSVADAGLVSSASTSSQKAAVTTARQPKCAGWMKQLQQELKQETLLQQQASRAAAAAAAQRASGQRAAAWKQAQQVLPFKSGPSTIAGTQHSLHKTLSSMIRDAGPAAADAAAAAAAAVAAKAAANKAAAAAATAAQAPAATAKPGTVSAERTAVKMSTIQSMPCERTLTSAQPAAFANAPVAEVPSVAATAAASGLKGTTQTPVCMSLLEMHLKQQQLLQQQQQAVMVESGSMAQGTCSSPDNAASAGHAAASSSRSTSRRLLTASPTQAAPAADASSPRNAVVRTSRSAASGGSPRTKAAVWAAADAATDAEVEGYLRVHRQQQHLPAAALVLQCAWRSRGPRLAFSRYMVSRRKHAAAALGSSFSRWSHWTLAGSHRKVTAQRQAFMAWRELIQLQLVLCNQVVRALQKGALAGDTAGLLMWRLCTPPDQHHMAVVRPSLGGLLGSILKQKEPRMRLQAAFAAWQDVCQALEATRSQVHAHLAVAGLRWCQARLRDGLRFWLMYTVARRCEALGIMLPAFKPRSLCFEDWLWQHERRRQLRQQAAALFQRMCLRRFLGCWHGHCFKVRTMRAAWCGLVLHSTPELLRCGISAFKANWKEMRLQWVLLGGCFAEWQVLAKKYKAVAIMRRRIQQAADHRAKARTLSAFRKASHMSQLLSTAGVLKLWQSRPLVLAHMHAWMGDTLHMKLYLCWWRWKSKAVARVRLRAALGLHMYKAHWLDLELAFKGWQKAAAAARAAKPQDQQDAAQMQRKYTGAAALVVICDDGGEPVIGVPATPSPKLSGTAALLASPGAVVTAAPGSAPADVLASIPGPQSADKQPVNVVAPSMGSSPVLNAASAFAGGVAAGRTSDLSPTTAAAEPQRVEAQQDDEQEEPEQELDQEQPVFVSLADHPTALPWRPLARRGDVMANQGLQHMSGARLAKAVRDLRELEGAYIVKDNDSGSEGLLGSIVFARRTVSPGLQAMVTAQLPMNVLWRFSCAEDSPWWQRIVGLVQQHAPHPDSWRWLMRSYSSTRGNRTLGRKPSDLHDFLHSSCGRVAASPSKKVCCTMQKGPGFRGSTAGTAASIKGQNICSTGGSAVRPVRLAQLQLPGGADGTGPRSVRAQGNTTAVSAGSQLTELQTSSFAAGNISSGSNSTNTDAAAYSTSGVESEADGTAWPDCWTPDDIAWVCQLTQAEELLETAVHLLLGVGADSSEELYQKLRQMTRGQDLSFQGDLLGWLLSTAIAHDTAQARKVLLRARARDELLNATMELRERARALHLHFPLKFTLSTAGPVVDTRALWAAVISRVEAERDWDASSTDEIDDDPRSTMWLSLLQQQSVNDAGLAPARSWALDQPQPDQQGQQQQQQEEGRATWEYVNAEATTEQLEVVQSQLSIPVGLSESQLVTPRGSAEQAAGGEPRPMPSSLSQLSFVSTGNAAAVAIAAAAAVAGPEFGSPGLSPGGMLSQTRGSGELQLYHASRASTPAGNAQLQQQQLEEPIQQRGLMAEQKANRRKHRAEVKQQQKQQAFMTAAVELSGGVTARFTMPSAASATAAAAGAGADDASGFVIDGEIFAGPPAFGLGSALSSACSSKPASELMTPRVTGAASSRVSSGAAAAAGTATEKLVEQTAAASAPTKVAAGLVTSAAGVASQAAVQQQQQQSQSGQGWRAFAFNPSTPGGSRASTNSASSTGEIQQSSSSTPGAIQPFAEVALADGSSTLHGAQTAHKLAARRSISSTSRASTNTEIAEQTACSRPVSGSHSSSVYRMSSSGRPSTSSSRGDSSSRPGSSMSRPLGAESQPQGVPGMQTNFEADENQQAAVGREATPTTAAQTAVGVHASGNRETQEATESNSNQLLDELKGVLAGVLAPEEDSDSPAAALAREAAASLAGACTSWLEQQQHKEAVDSDAAAVAEQGGRLSSAASGRRPGSTQHMVVQQQIQQQLGRSCSSSPDIASSCCFSNAQPAAAKVAAVPGKSAIRAAQAVPSLALGNPNSVHNDHSASSSTAPKHTVKSGQVSDFSTDAQKLRPASREQQSTRSAGYPPPAAAPAVTVARQSDAAANSAGLTVMSYGKPSSAGSNQAVQLMPEIDGGSDDAEYLYQAGRRSSMFESQQDPPGQSQKLLSRRTQAHAVPAILQQQLQSSGDCCSAGQCQQQQQEQRQLQQQESNCSTLSSLPSIPSCSEMIDCMQQHSYHQHARKKKQQECQLPVITAGSSSLKQQQPMTAVEQQQQQQQLSEAGSVQLPKLQGQAAPVTATIATVTVIPTEHKAVWKAPASALVKHAAASVYPDAPGLRQQGAAAGSSSAVQPQAGGVSTLLGLDAPTLHDLLHDAAKDDWAQFEALASELAIQLSTALQASHAAAAAHRPAQRLPKCMLTDGVPDTQQQQQQWQGRQQEQQQTVLPVAGASLSAVSVLESNMQWGPAAMAAAAAGGGGTAAAPELNGVLAKLVTAPLAARFVFWKQVVTKQQQQLQQTRQPWDSAPCSRNNCIADQLHQLAWSSLLQQQVAKPLRTSAQAAAAVPTWSPDAGAVAHATCEPLRVKLQQYMQAHVQWRQQQVGAQPLIPAEKWPTLEHEEQVLDFITSLTISVYSNLLRKHRSMLAATATTSKQASRPAAFGSSSVRICPSGASPTAANGAIGTAAATAAVVALGQALTAARTASPTVPREARRKAGQVFVIPGPPNAAALWQQHAKTAPSPTGRAASGGAAGRASKAAACSHQTSTGLGMVPLHGGAADAAGHDSERLEALQGWQSATCTPATGDRPMPGSSRSKSAGSSSSTGAGGTGGAGLSNMLSMRHYSSDMQASPMSAGKPHGQATSCGGVVDASVTSLAVDAEGSRASCCSDTSSWQLPDWQPVLGMSAAGVGTDSI